MADFDGYALELDTDSSSAPRERSGTARDGYGFDPVCAACTPIPTAPEIVFVQTTGPRIKGPSALGGGIVRPFRRTEHQDFANDSGIPEVMSCVGQVLGTQKGALPWRPDFGCDLERLRHKNKTGDFVHLAQTLVDDALRRWEPRAGVVSVDIDSAAPENAIGLVISVQIAGQIKTLRL